MRIGAFNQINSIYKTNKSANILKTAYTSGTDQVSISQFGKDYQTAKQALASTSDIRQDKVTQLKESISSGEYTVDPEDFANRLLEKYNQLGL